jgi:hypothetical protein
MVNNMSHPTKQILDYLCSYARLHDLRREEVAMRSYGISVIHLPLNAFQIS